MNEKNKMNKLWIREEKDILEKNEPAIPRCPKCGKLMQVFVSNTKEYFYKCECTNPKTMLS